MTQKVQYANGLTLVVNPAAVRTPALGPEERFGYHAPLAGIAREALKTWRDYAPSPLVDLPGLASVVGVRSIVAKDEGQRTDLQSFKALGGAYALSEALKARIRALSGVRVVTVADLEGGRFQEITRTLTATCASDGNHGRSVAWGASRFGCGCIVYLPKAVSEERATAIAAYGSRVIRVDGNYDAAVRLCAQEATAFDRIVISDTATPASHYIPRLVMAGYSLLFEEAFEQIPSDQRPTHVFVQVGCGSLAAVSAGYVWDRFGTERPAIVAVEPVEAACLLETVVAGELATVDGEHTTIMGGLACGEVSYLAWEVLRRGLDFCLALPDEFAARAMRAFASGAWGRAITAGESGAAGAAALLALAGTPELKARLGLGPQSRVLVIITEGATAPSLYREIVGAASVPAAGQ